MGEQIAFIVLAFWVLGSAFMVVTLKNLVHAVLSLILVFFGVAGIFVLLNADFLAIVQVLVYAGGVGIMLVFGVMTVDRSDIALSNSSNNRVFMALPILLALFVSMLAASVKSGWNVVTQKAYDGSLENLAPVLLTDFVIPFEVAAILLTVALTGALFLVKEVE